MTVVHNGAESVTSPECDMAETDTDEPDESGRSRRDGLMSSFRSRLVVMAVLLVIVGAGTGLVGSLIMPARYVARAEVQYSLVNSGGGDLLREDRKLTTQLVTVTSRVVLAPVATGAGLTPEELAKQVSVRVVDESEVIEIQVRDASPDEAVHMLNKVVDRYIAVANTGWQDPVRSFVDAQLREVQRQLQAPPRPEDVTAPQGEVTTAALAERERYLLGLQSSLETDPSAAEAKPPARLLVPPYAVAEPIGPSPGFTAAAGAAAGLVIAAMVALFIARHRLRQ